MDEVSLLYESVLINEMTQDVVDYLDTHKDQLPFSKMFGDKVRLVVPIGGDLTAREILEDLKSLKDYSGIDVGSGEVIRKIKLDPKYGQGSEKEQKMSIGKAVNSLKIDPEKKKKYLDWLAKYKDNLNTALSDISDYVIILSRAPIDVVRMSDHRNISSCHSQGNSYFQCAVQEAVTGGAVAYVVDRDVLDYHLKDSVEALQDDDFFHDTDRGVQGIRPISRLRVRKIESKNGDELGVPDDRVYGDSSVPGFFKYLNEFLKNYQKDEIQSFIESEGKGWTARGGSYYDTSITTLVDNFVEQEGIRKIGHSSEDAYDESSWATRGWEEELEEIKNRYNNQMTYCSVDYQIEDNDENPYIIPSGSCTIDISSFGLPEDSDLNIEDSYDVERKGKNGHYDDEYIWSYIVNYLVEKVGIPGIGRLEITNQSIEISFYDENYSILRNPEDFDSNFSWEIQQFDRKIENMLEDPDELRNVFIEAGLISQEESINSESRYNDYLENDENYQTINLIGKTKTNFYLEWPNQTVFITPLGNPPRSPNIMSNNWAQKFQKFLVSISKELFKPKITIDPNQPDFKNFFESYSDNMEGINFYIDGLVEFNSTQFTQSLPKYTLLSGTIKLSPSGFENKYFEWYDFLDEISPHIKNFLKLLVLTTINVNDPEIFEYYKHHNLPQLEKIYGKYLH